MSGGLQGAEPIRQAPGSVESASVSSCVSLLQSPPDAMNGQTLQRKVTITNPQGLHLRPLAAFVKLARQYQSTVTVSREARRADGKSTLDLMSLGADFGCELVVEVSGSDAQAALDALTKLLASPSVDDGEALPPKG